MRSAAQGFYWGMLLTLLTGCASYQPLPLEGHLPQPNNLRAALAQAAAGEPLRNDKIDLQAPLSGTALAQIAVLLNPDLRATRTKLGVAQAQVFAARLLPDPQLSLSADLPSTAGYYSAYSLGLQWSLASLFIRSANLAIARAQSQSVHYDVAWQEWLLANQVRILARKLYFLRQQEAIATAATQVSLQLYRKSVENLHAGDTTLPNHALRQIAYVDSRDRELALRREVAKVRQELNAKLGLPPSFRLDLAAPRPLPKLPPVDDLVQQAIHHRLDLAALRAGYAAQEAQVRRAILGRYPGFSIGVSHAADTSNIQTWGPSLTFDLPLWNRNRAAIRQSEATRAELHAAYSARLFQTRAEIASLVQDLHRLQPEIELLHAQVPGLARAESVLRQAVAEHNATLVEYESVRSQLLDKKLQLVTLEGAQAEDQAALELAVGIPWEQWRKST
ncbi:TolC family protein [Acidithiobacillus sp. IBUN Pt1247-S3]|uniref:TolC family protein n=1 Tax=Acidithiobacillus sp. IBUN Pt1247-S3 TaxID=3166642 RepID=UPI0034E4413A